MSNSEKTRRLVGMSIFTALVIVLQAVATFVRFGPFSITLALTPIVIGAAMFGAGAGAWLGGVFGAVVLVMCIAGADLGGNILWNVNPIATAILCLFKGAAAGWCAGLAYRGATKKTSFLGYEYADIQPSELSKKLVAIRRHTGVALAAAASPVVNTGIFVAAMFLVYPETLSAWAGAEGVGVVYYAFLIMAGVNFLVELLVNAALSPAVSRIIKAESRGWMK